MATVFAVSWAQEEDFESPFPPHLKCAQRILCDVTDSKIATKYCHDNIKEEQGYRFNCYGFVNYVINQTHREAFEELISHMETLVPKGIATSLDPNNPSPYNFFHIFKNLYLKELTSQFWEGVEDIFSLEAGDILVSLNPNYISPLQWDKNDLSNPTRTHIMVVSAIINKSSNVLEIKIIDSTIQPHNQTDDTRYIHKINNGIGECSLWLLKTDGENTYRLLWENLARRGWVKDLYAGRLKKHTIQ